MSQQAEPTIWVKKITQHFLECRYTGSVHWLAKCIWNTGYLAFFKIHVKIFTPRTWKTAIKAFTCFLQRFVLFSALVIGNTTSCHRRVSYLKIIILVSQNPRHTTKTAPFSKITASSIHRLLTFGNAANKDVAVGRFRVPAAGANATKKTARRENWFSRNHHAG